MIIRNSNYEAALKYAYNLVHRETVWLDGQGNDSELGQAEEHLYWLGKLLENL